MNIDKMSTETIREYLKEREANEKFDPKKVYLDVFGGEVLVRYDNNFPGNTIATISAEGLYREPYINQEVPIKKDSNRRVVEREY